jgi:hypothetical protein
MSEHESILHALQPIARRMWWRGLRDQIVAGLCVVLAAALVYQVLRLIAPSATQVWRVLFGLVAVGAVAWVAWRAQQQFSLARAAGEADERANLKDELKSAHWFLQGEQRSPLINMLLQRAANTAKSLAAQRVVPGGAPRGIALLAVLAVLTGALAWWSPQLAKSRLVAALTPSGGAQDAAVSGAGEAATAAAKRAAQEAQAKAEAAAKEKAAAQERARALAEAQDAASAALGKADAGAGSQEWAKLEDALQRLGGKDADGALAAAIKARDAQRAAKLLAELARKQELAQADTAAQQMPNVPFSDHSEGFVPKLQDLFKQQEDPFDNPKGVEDPDEELRKAAETVQKLEENAQSSQRKQLRHEEAYSASIGRDSVIEASRYGERDPNEKLDSTGSSQTGETQMQGGVMHRRAAMTRGDPDKDGGSRVGEADGDSKADPMLGKKTERLKTQLKRVDIEAKKQDEHGEGDPDKFFAATRQQESKLAYTDVARRARYVTEEATSGEQVPLTYRNVVKDYFINLRQKEK